MKIFRSKFGIDDLVTLTLDSINHRNCTIVAVKFEESRIRLDVVLPNGYRLYDIDENYVELTETIASNIAKSELQ